MTGPIASAPGKSARLAESTASAESVEPIKPAGSVEPGNPVESGRSREPIESSESARPTESAESTKSAKSAAPRKPAKPTMPTESAERVESIKSAGSVESGRSREPVESSNPLASADSADLAGLAAPADSVVPVLAERLCKRFGALKALDEVSLEISAGECTALVGPNGAGKSTLFKTCLGLEKSDSGRLSVLGRSPRDSGFGEVKRRIGFLPEQVVFQPSLTGVEIMRFHARLKGADVNLNEAILERVRLGEAARRRVSTYSKGMRQRLGFAQALIGEPRLLLLDEPVSGLDPSARRNFFSIINEEKERGAAIVLSSHILTELEASADRVAILSRGRLKAFGPIARLRAELNLNSSIRLKAGGEQMERLAERFADRFGPTAFANGAVVLECAPEGKLDLLREIMGAGIAFENLDIVEPGLERIFAAHAAEGEME